MVDVRFYTGTFCHPTNSVRARGLFSRDKTASVNMYSVMIHYRNYQEVMSFE